jgi:hypothetical protein
LQSFLQKKCFNSNLDANNQSLAEKEKTMPPLDLMYDTKIVLRFPRFIFIVLVTCDALYLHFSQVFFAVLYNLFLNNLVGG